MNRMFFAQNVAQITPVIFTGTYGRLYNTYAIDNPLLPPVGWHIPQKSELETLIVNCGYSYLAGGRLKERTTLHWLSPNYGATDLYGFTLLPSGCRAFTGEFEYLTRYCYIGQKSDEITWDDHITVGYSVESTGIYSSSYKTNGFCVRCIKDDSVDPLSVSDYDGNVYRTVKIGNQVWMAQNYKCTKYNDGTIIPNITSNTEWAALTTGAMCAYDNDENNV